MKLVKKRLDNFGLFVRNTNQYLCPCYNGYCLLFRSEPGKIFRRFFYAVQVTP